MDAIGRTTEAPPGRGTRLRWSLSAEYEPFMAWLNASLTDPAPARLFPGRGRWVERFEETSPRPGPPRRGARRP